MDNIKTIKPFLKWAGGKTRLSTQIVPYIIKDEKNNYKYYAEPFLGSGAMFLNVQSVGNFDEYILNDSNSDLINLYKYIVANEYNIKDLKKEFNEKNNSKSEYIKLRSEFNLDGTTEERKAILFLYLNRHCFNGLCRYNNSKKFNVPFGKYASPYFPEKEILKFVDIIKAKKIRFSSMDYSVFMAGLPNSVVVYADPPYAPIKKESFTKYTVFDFGEADQKKLAIYSEELVNDKNGNNKIVISNHSTEFTNEIYKNAKIKKEIDVKRFISAKGNRDSVKELIVIYE